MPEGPGHRGQMVWHRRADHREVRVCEWVATSSCLPRKSLFSFFLSFFSVRHYIVLKANCLFNLITEQLKMQRRRTRNVAWTTDCLLSFSHYRKLRRVIFRWGTHTTETFGHRLASIQSVRCLCRDRRGTELPVLGPSLQAALGVPLAVPLALVPSCCCAEEPCATCFCP